MEQETEEKEQQPIQEVSEDSNMNYSLKDDYLAEHKEEELAEKIVFSEDEQLEPEIIVAPHSTMQLNSQVSRMQLELQCERQ